MKPNQKLLGCTRWLVRLRVKPNATDFPSQTGIKTCALFILRKATLDQHPKWFGEFNCCCFGQHLNK